MVEFKYIAPQSLEEALRALVQADGSAFPLAGGTILLVAMREGITQPALVVDLRHLDSFKQIHLDGDTLQIGALTTLAILEHSPIICQHMPVLANMASKFGNPLIRSAATLGGNLAWASPFADAAVPLLALDAQIRLQASGERQREIAFSTFLSGDGQSVKGAGELITYVSIPTLTSNTRWFYYKLGRRKAGSSAIVSVSVLVELQNERVQKARIALGAVAPNVLRAYQAEAALTHEILNEKTIAKCLEILDTEIAPSDDIFASAAYRSSMAKALVAKALKQFIGQ